MASTVQTPRIDEPCWPTLGGERILFLLDAATGLEERLLRAWVQRNLPEGADKAEVEIFRIPSSRRRRRRSPDPKLEAPDLETSLRPALLRIGDRIAWLVVRLPGPLDPKDVERRVGEALDAPGLERRHRRAIADAIAQISLYRR